MPASAFRPEDAVFNLNPDAILRIDSNGALRGANPAAKRLLHITPTTRLTDLFEGNADLSRALRDMTDCTFDTSLKQSTGLLPVRVNVRRADADTLLCFLRDISGEVQERREGEVSEARLQFALTSAGIGDWDMDIKQNIARRSFLHDACFGYDEPVEHWGYDTFLSHIVDEDRARVHAVYSKALQESGDYDVEFRVRWPDGSTHWLWSKGCFYHDDTGHPARVAGIQVDITARKRSEEMLRISEKAMSASADGIVIVDATHPDMPMTFVNPAFERITGYLAEEVIGRNCRFLQGDDRDQRALTELRAALGEHRDARVVLRNYRKDGTPFWNEVSISPVRDENGTVTHYIGIQNDITEQRQYSEALAHQATHDDLTGLPNRTLLELELAHALKQACRQRRHMAVAFLDLDHFKLFNDSIGHGTGDRILQLAAARLLEAARPGEVISRFGGDEFVVLMPAVADQNDATSRVSQLLQALCQPASVDEHDIMPAASVGIAVFPEHGNNAADLLKHADIAMYEAKRYGRGTFRCFMPRMLDPLSGRVSLESRLRRALEQQQFHLHFQPQAQIAGMRLVGIEALIRWECPEFGLINPAQFIGVAEESGLIVPIGAWVLHAACQQMREWQRVGLPSFRIAVNVSLAQFRHGNLLDVVDEALESSGLNPHDLELEVTESLAMKENEYLVRTLAVLRERGVAVAIDDFGTGFSGLSQLQRFPVDRLKIDRSFTRNVAKSDEAATIVRSIIQLAHGLNLHAIAEGVETGEQAAALRDLGCDEIQGYWVAMPQDATETTRLLRSGSIFPGNIPA